MHNTYNTYVVHSISLRLSFSGRILSLLTFITHIPNGLLSVYFCQGFILSYFFHFIFRFLSYFYYISCFKPWLGLLTFVAFQPYILAFPVGSYFSTFFSSLFYLFYFIYLSIPYSIYSYTIFHVSFTFYTLFIPHIACLHFPILSFYLSFHLILKDFIFILGPIPHFYACTLVQLVLVHAVASLFLI